MASNTPQFDTSTICDLTLKAWLDQYPQEKTSALQDKYLSLERYLRDAIEKHTKLAIARVKLDDLTKGLEPVLPILLTAAQKRQNFQLEYGDLGVSPQTSYDTIEKMVRHCYEEISQYAANVEAAYFKNLDEADKSIAYLRSLKDFYQTLFNAIVKIRDSYFKTEPNRRKPVIRDLCRNFTSLADNNRIFGIAPTIENSLYSRKMDKAEYDSLLAVRREAGKTADILKRAR